MQRSRPTLFFKPFTLFPPTLYLPSAPSSTPHVCGCFPTSSSSCFLSDSLSVLQWNAGGLRARIMHYSTLPLLVQWILSVPRNPTLTHLPLPRSLYFLLCDLITLSSGLSLFFPMTCTLVVASSFSSGRAYPSLSSLSSLPFHLTLTPPRSLFLIFMLLQFALLRWIANPTPFPSPFLPLPEISLLSGTSTAITPLGLKRYF